MREAEVAVSETAMEAMGVDELLSLTRDAGLRIVEELVCRGNGAVLQIDVSERIDEERLSILDCVDGWNHVVERDSSHLYVISFTAPKLPESLEETSTGLIGSCDPEIDDSDATLSLVGSHDAISGQLSGFDEGGVSPTLQRISGNEGATSPLDELSARQREVIQTAWNMGFYEVPKEAPADDIATELSLDPSTVNEHLQRAERNFLRQFF